jgi:hypothetical protein
VAEGHGHPLVCTIRAIFLTFGHDISKALCILQTFSSEEPNGAFTLDVKLVLNESLGGILGGT